jgi:molecular chaperone HscB
MFKVLDSAVPIACWSCSIGHNDSTLFCPHCSKIQPPPGGDYFSVFGLEPKLNLDLAALEHEFHRLSRKLHPDRFARAGRTKSSGAWPIRRCSTTPIARSKIRSAAPNTCSSCRARRLAKSTAAKKKRPSRVPADLLEEVFELNMQLEEMRMARKMGEKIRSLQASLEQAKRKFDGLLERGGPEDLRAQWQGVGRGRRRRARPRKRRWWPCSTGGATSAIWFAT